MLLVKHGTVIFLELSPPLEFLDLPLAYVHAKQIHEVCTVEQFVQTMAKGFWFFYGEQYLSHDSVVVT